MVRVMRQHFAVPDSPDSFFKDSPDSPDKSFKIADVKTHIMFRLEAPLRKALLGLKALLSILIVNAAQYRV